MNIKNFNSENIRVITTVVGIFLVLFASIAAPKLPRKYTKYLENKYIRILIFLLIAYLSTIDISTAIIAVVAVLVSYQTLSQQMTTEVILNETNNLLNNIPFNMPSFDMPTFDMPTVSMPIDTPTVDMQTVDMQTVEMPTVNAPQSSFDINADYSLNPFSFIDNLSISNLIEPEGSDNTPIYASSEVPINVSTNVSSYTSTENTLYTGFSTQPIYASVDAPRIIINKIKENKDIVINTTPEGIIENEWNYDNMDIHNVELDINTNIYNKSINENIDNTLNGFDENDNEYAQI